MARPVLVLGAEGQVGRAVLTALARAGRPAIGLGRQRLNITDEAKLDDAFADIRPSVTINAAAYTAVDRAETERAVAFAVNGRAPGLIADAAMRHDSALIHLSTDYVFDGEKRAPYVESDPVAPLSVYGESKRSGEDAVRRSGVPGMVLRTSWLLAAGGFTNAILTRSQAGEALRVVNDQMGRPTFVHDLAEALAALASDRERLPAAGDIYHYAGSVDATWFTLASELVDVWSARTQEPRPALVGIASSAWKAAALRPLDSRLDSARIAADFGLTGRDWRAGVPDLVEAWLREAHR